MNYDDVELQKKVHDQWRSYEDDGPKLGGQYTIQIQMGTTKPVQRGFIDSNWFEPDPPRAFVVHEQKCGQFIQAYYPELVEKKFPGMTSIMQEVWKDQKLTNMLYGSFLDMKHDPNADLREFSLSLELSKARRAEPKHRLPRVPIPKLYLRERIAGFKMAPHRDPYDDEDFES